MQKKLHTRLRHLRIKKPTKRQCIIGLLGLVGVLMLAQLFYPSDRLLPFAKLDTLNAGGWQKKDAARQLNETITQKTIPVQRGNEGDTYVSVNPKQLGVTIDTSASVESVSYPWYMRLLPTSVFWYGTTQKTAPYSYKYDTAGISSFITKQLADCKLAPQNASLVVKDKKLSLLKAKNGGVCKKTDVESAIKQLRPTASTPATLAFAAVITPPKISDKDATTLKQVLEGSPKDTVITAGNESVAVARSTLISWLVFDSSGDKLTYTLDPTQSDAYFAKEITPKVTVTPGVTKITTRDFAEISRVNGAPGRVLDANATRQAIIDGTWGAADKVIAATKPTPPTTQYTRTYSSSDAGLSALVQQFAEDNPGTYGVQYIELAGQKRRASYNESRPFITASTYKLFVAYSTLKRVESGQWQWSDQVTGGQNLSTCFDKMIVNSDNACAEALYGKIGYKTVINEARALGLSNTTLDNEAQKTSAGDLATLLGSIYSGTIDINATSRARLIDAMKRNVYRQGIPAGSTGTVADKVGFLNGLLHDASIVYSPKGDYVLVIMTDGSSWAKIAELTRKIESIR